MLNLRPRKPIFHKFIEYNPDQKENLGVSLNIFEHTLWHPCSCGPCVYALPTSSISSSLTLPSLSISHQVYGALATPTHGLPHKHKNTQNC